MGRWELQSAIFPVDFPIPGGYPNAAQRSPVSAPDPPGGEADTY